MAESREEAPRTEAGRLSALVGKRLTDARIEELIRAAGIPLHGTSVSVDLQARYVAAAIRADVLDLIEAEAATQPPSVDLDAAWSGLTTDALRRVSIVAANTMMGLESNAGESLSDIISRHRPLIEAAVRASVVDGAGLDVERLARAMHPVWFEDLSNQRPATLTDREWGQMVLNVTLNRTKAIREASDIAAEYAAISATSTKEPG